MSIRNMADLRENAIETLQLLRERKISIEEAGVTGKLYENVISSVKTQIEYAKATKQLPLIDFLEDCTLPAGRLLDQK